ncbi:MAG: polysaccharide biosynthesis tyrosine autokinase [Fibrobacter sp.]|nr:polysaccharide biosynthesis tyrosine autokinase [Fibrobacter sp.]
MSENEQRATISLAQIQAPQAGDTITLMEALSILWKKKFLLLLFMVLGTVVGVLLGNWIRPQYTSDALLQIDVKGNKTSKAMGEMGALLDVASPADAEIELIKSRMVLASVVEDEHLCFKASPVGRMDRLLHQEGRMDLEFLYIPERARDGAWRAVVTGPGSYVVVSPEGSALIEGVVGDMVKAPHAGDTLAIRVNFLRAQEGKTFVLSQTSSLSAIRSLAKSLNVAEKGKKSGIISVSYSHRFPDRAAAILNSVANTYLRQNVEMRSAEAEKTLEFLEEQLPGVKAKLDSAEKVLADYRYRIGSVDMTGETQVHLQKEVDLQKQILQMEQERQRVTRLFKAEHPNVLTLNKQLDKLRKELAKLKVKAEKMPLTQQEVMRLQEEVQVNNALYTTMLNNIQQLRVVRAGEVGNVRVVDFAQVEQKPSKPKKFNILVCSVAASFMLGVLLVFLMRMLRNGVRSSLEIERETDTSVYAKIPQFKEGVKMLAQGKKHKALVLSAPDNPACESLRSLQTAIDFSVPEAKRVMMVTGLIPGVGKSFVSINLACLYAMSGKKVLLVDADMRRGVHHGNKKYGLADALCGKCNLQDAVATADVDNLYIMGAGNISMAPSDLLRGGTFEQLLQLAKHHFDVVIVDTPPMDLVTDAELICGLVDFNLLVLHYGKHSMDSIKDAIGRLKRYSEKPCAFVLNHCEREPGHYYGNYYGKYYSKKK